MDNTEKAVVGKWFRLYWRAWFWAIALAILCICSISIFEHYIESEVRNQLSLLNDKINGKCSVDFVDYSVLRQRLLIKGFRIGNPPGYREGNAVKADTVIAEVNPFALRRKVIHLKKLHIEGSFISFELRRSPEGLRDLYEMIKTKQFNLWALTSRNENKSRHASLDASPVLSGEEEPGADRSSHPADSKAGEEVWRLKIDELYLSWTRLSLDWFNSRFGIFFCLPEYRECNLGGDDGTTPAQLLYAIIQRQRETIEGNIKRWYRERWDAIKEKFTLEYWKQRHNNRER